MTFLLLLPLWIQSGLIPAPPTVLVEANRNLVRICAETAGAAAGEDCPVFDARDLEPHATGIATEHGSLHSQLAFVDPETLDLVQPTRDQLDEITNLIFSEETQSKRGEPFVAQTLPDGTVTVRLAGRFQVHLTATVRLGSPNPEVEWEGEKR